jgi:hypothetical protein
LEKLVSNVRQDASCLLIALFHVLFNLQAPGVIGLDELVPIESNYLANEMR